MGRYIYGIYAIETFVLGAPLTVLYGLLMPYIGQFLIWAMGTNLRSLVPIPVSALFIIQWIIWSQLIVWTYRKFRKTLT